MINELLVKMHVNLKMISCHVLIIWPCQNIYTRVDHITIPSKLGKGVLRRTTEVFDCWFESGSMPYAQVHYPFERKKEFDDAFPADFIAEGIDQTRGWLVSAYPQMARHLGCFFKRYIWYEITVGSAYDYMFLFCTCTL